MTTLQNQVNDAKSLTAVRDILNGFKPEVDDERLEDIVDLCSLPAFGGVTPSNTADVWSWDATTVLLYVNGQYYIEVRDPNAWYDRGNQ